MQQFTEQQMDTFCDTLYNRITPDMQNIYVNYIINCMIELIVTDLLKRQPALNGDQINHKLATIKKYPKAIASLYKTYKARGELDELWNLPIHIFG